MYHGVRLNSQSIKRATVLINSPSHVMRFALLNTVWHPLKLFGRDNNKLGTVHTEVLQYKLSLSYRLTLMDLPKV